MGMQRAAIPFLLVSLVLLLLPVSAAGGGEETAGTSQWNRKGLSYFNKGYYEDLAAGRTAAAEENFRKAAEAFQEAVAVDDRSVEAHRNLGRVYMIQKKYELAAGEYRKVIVLEPENVDARLPLASVLEKLGRPEEAMDVLKEAKSLTRNSIVLKNLDGLINKLETERGTK